MAIEYEWVIEELDGPDEVGGDPEILDVNHADTYTDAQALAVGLTHYRIGLVRDDDRGRSWAYVRGPFMASHLQDAYGHNVCAVPARYRKQFQGGEIVTVRRAR